MFKVYSMRIPPTTTHDAPNEPKRDRAIEQTLPPPHLIVGVELLGLSARIVGEPCEVTIVAEVFEEDDARRRLHGRRIDCREGHCIRLIYTLVDRLAKPSIEQSGLPAGLPPARQ
jgi:hypothetical protein